MPVGQQQHGLSAQILFGHHFQVGQGMPRGTRKPERLVEQWNLIEILALQRQRQ